MTSNTYHVVPGRLRVRSPKLKKSQRAALSLQKLPQRMAGVTEVTVNPVTGSALFLFDPDRTGAGQILQELAALDLFDLEQAMPSSRHFDQSAERAGEAVGKVLLSAAVDRALQGSPLALLSLLI